MLTVLTMVVGFFSSMAPELLKRWQDKADKKHELALLDLQLKQADNAHVYRMDEIGVQAYAQIVESGHREQEAITLQADKWVINLAASVRPIITYLFIMAFIGFKMAALAAAINPNLPWNHGLTFTQAIMAVWGEEETAIVGGILAFWFGDRSMAGKRRPG